MTKFKVDVDFPEIELQINRQGLLRQIGNTVAKAVRARLNEGDGASGSMPTDLQDTGELIRSVKYRPRRKKDATGKWKSIEQGVVFPTGRRNDGKKNAMLLAVHLARDPSLKASEPMGLDPALEKVAGDAAKKAVADQIRKREIKLAAKKANRP